MSDEPSAAATQALTIAKVNEQALRSHEELCAERYNTINLKIDKLEAIVKWIGGLMASAIIAVLGWSVSQQIESAKAQQAAAAAKIELLQKQVQDANAGREHVIQQIDRLGKGEP